MEEKKDVLIGVPRIEVKITSTFDTGQEKTKVTEKK